MSRPIQPADYEARVHTIRVLVQTPSHSFQADPHNGDHTSIYLILQDGRSSIYLDMSKAGPTDTWGTYQTSFCNYTEPNSALKYWDLKAHDRLVVKDILEILVKKNHYKYQLNHHGIESRYWCQIVVIDLEKKSCIAKHSPVKVEDVVLVLCCEYPRERIRQIETKLLRKLR